MAVAMQRRMEELQKLWNDKGYEQPFRQRMGIHTGYCTVGNFGSDLRINYTAIGPAVNLAASLQQLGEPGEIRISYETHALVQEVVATEERPPIQFRGMSRAIKTYAVSGSAHQVTSVSPKCTRS